MKKFIVLGSAIVSIGLMTGCEDKVAEDLQNQKIDSAVSEVSKMNGEIESLRRENAEMRQKLDVITDYIRKKVEEAKAKAANSTVNSASGVEKTNLKTSPTTIKKKSAKQ